MGRPLVYFCGVSNPLSNPRPPPPPVCLIWYKSRSSFMRTDRVKILVTSLSFSSSHGARTWTSTRRKPPTFRVIGPLTGVVRLHPGIGTRRPPRPSDISERGSEVTGVGFFFLRYGDRSLDFSVGHLSRRTSTSGTVSPHAQWTRVDESVLPRRV